MFDKIKKLSQSSSFKACSIGLLSVLALIMFFDCVQAITPSLNDVLASQRARARGIKYSTLFASVLALSLGGLSLAGGYKIMRKGRVFSTTVLLDEEEPTPERAPLLQPQVLPGVQLEPAKDLEIKELTEANDQLRHLKQCLQDDNVELREQINQQASDLDEISHVEQMLRKSNITLSRECERLHAENEALTLRVNSLAMPLSAASRPKKARQKKKVVAKKKRG